MLLRKVTLPVYKEILKSIVSCAHFLHGSFPTSPNPLTPIPPKAAVLSSFFDLQLGYTPLCWPQTPSWCNRMLMQLSFMGLDNIRVESRYIGSEAHTYMEEALFSKKNEKVSEYKISYKNEYLE